MTVDTVQQNHIGLPLRVYVKNSDGTAKDIRDATTRQIKVKSPTTGTVETLVAGFVTDGVDGGVQFVTVDGTIDESADWGSNWKIQAYIVQPSESYHTEIGEFYVAPNLS